VTFGVRRAKYPDEKGQLMEMWLALYTWVTDRDAEWESMRDWFARKDAATFVGYDAAKPEILVGYADVGARSVVDGCEGPAAYLEAWYVKDAWRKQGVGEALLRACEDWARAQGYKEMGSDALLDNTNSHHLHEKFGFEENDRVITYRKSLS
jgi:aminoglycoside 6'-N-acetyltransferase I